MPGRGRSRPPAYEEQLRRPGERLGGPVDAPSNAELEADRQCDELEQQFQSMCSEFTKDESSSPPPGRTVDYPTPPVTPGEDAKNTRPVNGSAYVTLPTDEKPSLEPSGPQASSFNVLTGLSVGSTGEAVVASGTATSPVMTSQLNPFADEFRPSWSLPADMPSYPSDTTASYDTNDTTNALYNSTPDDFALEAFNNAFAFLTSHPHQFDDFIKELKTSLEVYVNEESTLETITNMLMEWCILEPNFQHTGARIATYLNTNLEFDPTVIKTKFIKIFLGRCKQELVLCKQNAQSPDYYRRTIGYSLFLGELYSTFKTESGLNLGALRRGLLEMLQLLFDIGSEEMLIAAGKILKMAGSLLDNPLYLTEKDNPDEMMKMFERIDNCVMDAATSKKAKEFLLSVIKLRQSNWGQVEVGSPSPTTQKTLFAYPASSKEYVPPASSQPPVPGAGSYQEQAKGWSQEDSLKPVTSPEQWDEFWTGEDDDTDEMMQYFMQGWSEGDHDDFEMEFRKFLIESEQLQ